jgi:hypothetical protein
VSRRIAVVVRAAAPARAAEALRGAVGLTLRGDRVEVVVADGAAADAPDAVRAIATLRAFGYPVHVGDAAIALVVAAADAVEVWT